MQKYFVTLTVCGLLIGTASRAAAQGTAWTDRAYFGLNWATQSGKTELNGDRTFTLYDEEARLSTTGEGDAGPMLDLNGGVRVWRNVSVGIGYYKVSSKADAQIEGSIPHPLFFGRPRAVTDTVPSLHREESGVHLQFGYTLPLNEKLDVMVYGGPTFFRVSQDVVSDVVVSELGFPFSSVQATATTRHLKESPVGGHFGADVTYKLFKMNKVALGAGGFFRWAGASTTLRVLDSDIKSDVGGAQVGFGVRIRY